MIKFIIIIKIKEQDIINILGVVACDTRIMDNMHDTVISSRDIRGLKSIL